MSTLLKKQMRFWVRIFWTAVFFAVISLAVLIQVGRTVFPVIDEYRLTIEFQLSQQLGVDLSIGEIEAVWQGLRPRVAFSEVSILNDLGEPVFEIGQIDVELSILKTLHQRSLSFRRLSFSQLEASIVQSESGAWRVQGLPESTSMSSSRPDDIEVDDPLDIFLFGRRLELVDTTLDVQFYGGLTTSVVIPRIRLENDADFHRLVASFSVDGEGEGEDLHLLVEGTGDPRDESTFAASGFLTLTDFPMEKALAVVGVDHDILLPKNVSVDRNNWQNAGTVDLKLWIDLSAEKGFSWQGDVNIEGVPFVPRDGMLLPETIVSGFSGQWQVESGWALNLSGLKLKWQDFSAPMLNLIVSAEPAKPVTLAMDSLNVADWYSTAERAGLIPEVLKPAMNDLKPRGILQNIWVNLLGKEDNYFSLKALVHDGGVDSWEDVPAIKQVNGYVEANAFGGHVSLDSRKGFSLGFPKIYQHSLEFNEASGDVRWKIDLAKRWIGVSSGLLRLRNDDVSARGYLNLDIPFKSSPGVEPEMTLVVGVEKGVARLHKMLVPNTVPEELSEWLARSIKDGFLTDAGFVYRGSLVQDNFLSRVVQFGASVHHAELKFDPEWPALMDASGVLLLDDTEFRATNLRGRMMDTNISNGELSLIQLSSDTFEQGEVATPEPAILLKAKVSGDSGRALALLGNTPIAHILGDEVSSWKMQGEVHGSVALIVPLNKASDEGRQNIQLELIDNQLEISSLNLSIKQISGPFSYTHDGGVASTHLRASLWGQPIEGSVKTVLKGVNSSIHVDMTGLIDVHQLQRWTERPELMFAEGLTSWQANLSVPLVDKKAPIKFNATSSMEGIHITLPPPFQKQREQSIPLQVAIVVYPSELNPEQVSGEESAQGLQQYWFSFGDIADAIIVSDRDSLQGGSVVIGGDTDGIVPGSMNVSGRIPVADIGLWSDAVIQYEQYVERQEGVLVASGLEVSDGAALPIHMDIQVEALQLESLSFDAVSVKAFESEGSMTFAMNSEKLAGTCTIFDDERPMNVDLDYFRMDASGELPEVASEASTTDVDGLVNVDVSSLPAMDFSVKEFTSGETNYGEWAFKLRPISGGVIAYDLYAQVLDLTIRGKAEGGAELVWLQKDGRNESFFSGLVAAKNIGSAMVKWDMEKLMTSSQARYLTDVQWLGAPDEISLEGLFGIIDVDMEDGRFIRGAEVGENPLVKLIGLMNFDTLIRRFRFDFSDLNPEGMSYDRVTGSFKFQRGAVVTQRPLFIDMAAGDIQFEGDIDVIEEQVEAQVVLTLPLAGLSTTIAAALTGGIPLVVGVFVVGKIFKRQVDEASSARFRLSGSWEDPDMKLEKIFDNKLQQ